MSDTIKKELETSNLLEEAEDLAIGAGTGSVVNAVNPGSLIISSALPPVQHLTLRGNCGIVVTKDLICRGKITLL